MPRFTPRPLHAGRRVRLTRWACDGHDAPRPVTEHASTPVLMVVLGGSFAFRDRHGRAVASPATAIAVAAGHEYEIRHPGGCGDVTLGVAGELARAFVAAGPTARPVSPATFVALSRLAATPVADPLAAEEATTAALAALDADLAGARPAPRAGRADREIAAAIDHAIALRAGADVQLADLAAAAAVSVAHACRAYRRATGLTIHGRVQETRLRHALALIVDGDRPLGDVALATGFANQGHLGNAFRARFGTTPARARCRPELIGDRAALAGRLSP